MSKHANQLRVVDQRLQDVRRIPEPTKAGLVESRKRLADDIDRNFLKSPTHMSSRISEQPIEELDIG